MNGNGQARAVVVDIALAFSEMGASQNWGYHFRSPNNKDYSVLGSILGSPYLGKLPNEHDYNYYYYCY